MSYNPLAAFDIGQKIGKAKRSTFGMSSDTMAEEQKDKRGMLDKVFPTLIGAQFKENLERSRPLTESQQVEMDLNKAKIGTENARANRLQNYGSNKAEEAAEKKRLLGAGPESGKMAFIKVALKEGIPGARNILFPDKTTKSFNRGAAINSTLWGGTPMPFDKDAQNLYRQLGSSLAARRFMLTGQASNQQEVKELVSQFMSQWGSDPDALMGGINQIENEFNEYLSTADPSGLFHEQPTIERADTAPDASNTTNDRVEQAFQRLKEKYGAK